MCGIVGTTLKGWPSAEMLKSVRHRGPDGIARKRVGDFELGFARLAITGHDTEAHILSENGDWLLFNGEIFGYPKVWSTDTEYLFGLLRSYSYIDLSNGTLPELNGQFAFAFWSEKNKKLVLGRDFFGERPLYYLKQGRNIHFASETKVLLPLLPKRRTDYQDIGFLETKVMDIPNLNGYAHNTSMVEGIEQVPPNTLLVFGKQSQGFVLEHKIAIHPKWETPEETTSIGDILYNSIVERADHGNHEIGAYLSGGLDSALVCCIARPKHVFTCVFDNDIGRREFEFAAKVAKRIGAKHHTVVPKVTKDSIKETVYYMDGPQGTMSPVADFALAKEASKHVKAVLTGQGADELFCGYFRDLLFYNDMLLRHRYPKYSPLMDYYHGGQVDTVCRALTPKQKMAEAFLHLLARGDIPDSARRAAYYFAECAPSVLKFVNWMEIAFTLPTLVQMNDRAAAHAGIESRSPFLDHELFRCALGLPDDQKITLHNNRFITKKVLRDVARGIVPDDIIDCEEKVGLHVPMPLFRNKPGLRGAFSREGYAKFCQVAWAGMVRNPRKPYVDYCLNKTKEV